MILTVKKRKQKIMVYVFFMIVYSVMAYYNFIRSSEWVFDNLFAIILLTFALLISNSLRFEANHILLLNVALVVHNLGTFGLYSLQYSVFQYDNLVHFIASFVGAYLLFNSVSSRLCVRTDPLVKPKKRVIERKVFMIFLVMSCVALLGVIVEVIEFSGFMFLGPGEGILFTGIGDGDMTTSIFQTQYIDTMQDILLNIAGSFVGVIVFYYSVYKRKSLQFMC